MLKRQRRKKTQLLGPALVAPALIMIASINIFPSIWAVYLSFSRYDFNRNEPIFTGLQNFMKVAPTRTFLQSLDITLTYAAVVTVGSSLIGLALAIILDQHFKGRGVVRSLLVIPWAVPWAVSAFLWSSIFSSDFGVINGVLYSIGLIKDYIPFLSKDYAIYSVAVATIWNLSSFTGLICLAALQSVPQELYEAAEVDGANIIQRFRQVTLPWIRPLWALTIILNALTAITMFDLVFLMTGGGPGDATLLLSIQTFRTFFSELRIGEGAATAVLMTLVALVVGLIYLRVLYRRSEIYK